MQSKKPFVFLANKGWSSGVYDRGGLQWLFEAFSNEFTNKDNVCLKVKINPVYNKPNWNLIDEMSKLKLNRKNKAKIFTRNDIINDDGLRAFYNSGDVFVSTSMAEAFNLPCIEAMACGLPVVATKFGGQADFVNDKNGWILKQGELVNWSKELSYEDIKWFKPNIKEIQKTLRYVYEHQNEVINKGKIALKDANKYTWTETAKKIKGLK